MAWRARLVAPAAGVTSFSQALRRKAAGLHLLLVPPLEPLVRSAPSLPMVVVAAALLTSIAEAPLSARSTTVPLAVRGSVILPDEGSPTGLHAYLSSDGHRDSVAIGDAGVFELAITPAHCGPLELRIDSPPATDRRYHAARVHLDRAGNAIGPRSRPPGLDGETPLRVLLVPTRHVIDGGTHAGTVVPIALDAALAPGWERTRYWRVARAASDGYGTPVAWPATFFPIPVALRARGGVSASDSAAFWSTARQLETDFGRSLFEPVPDDPTGEEIWKITVMVEPAVTTAGMTFVTYDSHGAVYEATIAIRSRGLFADERLVSHELMHALGFGHSSGWYSAATPTPGTPSRATASDVAYAQLLYRLRRAHIAQRATHGILASSREARSPLSARASQCAR